MESVKSRETVESMRKQLLVFNLKNNNKHDSHKKYGKKDISSKINLHVEKNKLEEKISHEKKLNKDVEKNIVIKSSDLIFDCECHHYFLQ